MKAFLINNILKNTLVWILTFTFITLNFLMNLPSNSSFFEGFFSALPLFLVYLCFVIKLKDKISQCAFGFYLLNVGFFLGTMLSMILTFHNSDLRAWWVLGLAVHSLYALGFSGIYSLISSLFDMNSKTYNILFCGLLIIALILMWCLSFNFTVFRNIFSHHFILASLLIFHLVNCCLFKFLLVKKRFVNNLI
ncbi:MAG: hypothetical protein LCH30_08945 [Proteobacteria bacterium]|nr:hypothetical protein [Pseudomonadota bacterium]